MTEAYAIDNTRWYIHKLNICGAHVFCVGHPYEEYVKTLKYGEEEEGKYFDLPSLGGVKYGEYIQWTSYSATIQWCLE